MSKKRGFTLVEVLVVIAITTLVFALVGGAMVFLTKSSGDLIHKSEAIIQAQTIEKHLRSFVGDNNKVYFSKIDNNYVLSKDKLDNPSPNVICNNTSKDLIINGTKYEGISGFSLYKKDDDHFVRCTFTIFNNNQSTEYTFILGIYPEQ